MDAHRLTRLLSPRSVAVVGAKKANDYCWLRCASTFQGPVYSVNLDPHGTAGIKALGVRNYRRLVDIPGPVDYAIVSVPGEVAPIVLRDCIATGVGGAMPFTSGFGETGTDKGCELERTITQMARESNLPLIGPNCMGVSHPKIGLRNFPELYADESGPNRSEGDCQHWIVSIIALTPHYDVRGCIGMPCVAGLTTRRQRCVDGPSGADEGWPDMLGASRGVRAPAGPCSDGLDS